MNKRVQLKIYGDVQGVFYRWTAKEVADKLNITGWIKNEPNGIVLIVAEGEEENLREFIKWCYSGPKYAVVTKIDEEWKEAIGEFKEFSIKF